MDLPILQPPILLRESSYYEPNYYQPDFNIDQHPSLNIRIPRNYTHMNLVYGDPRHYNHAEPEYFPYTYSP